MKRDLKRQVRTAECEKMAGERPGEVETRHREGRKEHVLLPPPASDLMGK